jgi:hypothetical protein
MLYSIDAINAALGIAANISVLIDLNVTTALTTAQPPTLNNTINDNFKNVLVKQYVTGGNTFSLTASVTDELCDGALLCDGGSEGGNACPSFGSPGVCSGGPTDGEVCDTGLPVDPCVDPDPPNAGVCVSDCPGSTADPTCASQSACQLQSAPALVVPTSSPTMDVNFSETFALELFLLSATEVPWTHPCLRVKPPGTLRVIRTPYLIHVRPAPASLAI